MLVVRVVILIVPILIILRIIVCRRLRDCLFKLFLSMFSSSVIVY